MCDSVEQKETKTSTEHSSEIKKVNAVWSGEYLQNISFAHVAATRNNSEANELMVYLDGQGGVTVFRLSNSNDIKSFLEQYKEWHLMQSQQQYYSMLTNKHIMHQVIATQAMDATLNTWVEHAKQKDEEAKLWKERCFGLLSSTPEEIEEFKKNIMKSHAAEVNSAIRTEIEKAKMESNNEEQS